MITDADVAELYEALGRPGAAHFRRNADDEAAYDFDRLQDGDDAAERLSKLLDTVPEPVARNTKHDADCWQRHAACLADKIREIIN